MIKTIDVECNAANPNLPLKPMFAFVNSPSSIRVRNVPKRIGDWCIRKVYFTAVYPDSTVKTAECVLTGGVWVGTIEGTNTSGTSTNGYTIFADGTDENGNNVTGYVLGKGDIEILEADGTLSPDPARYTVKLLSAEATQPREGDMYPTDDGYVIWQDGEAHLLGTPFEQITAYVESAVSAKADLSAIPSNTSQLSNDSNFITSEEVKPFYKFDTSTGTSKPTEMACYSVILAGMYKANNRADKYAEVQPLVEFDPVELTPKFTLGALYLGYHPWKLSKFFEQTYSPELELVWWYGQICRVLAGHFIQSYTGFMWRTKGVGFAIPCDENGIPDGRLYEITQIEQTSPYRIGYNNTTQIHTITGNENWSAILTIDEQENQITCTRSIVQRAKENRQTFPTLDDIPTSTSQLTNDSGFITSADIPTPSYIEDENHSKIEADLNCSTFETLEETWVVNGIPFTTTKGYTSCSYFPANPEQDDVGYELTLTQGSSWAEGYYDLQIIKYYWANVAEGESDPDWQWVQMSGGATGGLQEGATSFEIDGYTGTYPYTGLVNGKLARIADLSNLVTTELVEPYTTVAGATGYARKSTTSWTVASKNSHNNGYEFPVLLVTVEDGTTARASLERIYMPEWNLSLYDQTTYSPAIPLTWQLLDLKRVRNGRQVTVYNNYGWISDPDPDGKQYAIACEAGTNTANPSFLYYNDGTGSKFSVSKAITLAEGGMSIESLAGGTPITCTRQNKNWSAQTKQFLANVDDVNNVANTRYTKTETDTMLEQKRALSDFNVYVDPMADMTTTKFNVVVSYAGDSSQPLFTAELTHPGGTGTSWTWNPSGSNQSMMIDYSSINGSYSLYYFNLQDGGGNEHSGSMTLPIAAPYWTGEVQDDWFHFSVTSQTTTITTKAYVDSLIAQLSARITALENNNQ